MFVILNVCEGSMRNSQRDFSDIPSTTRLHYVQYDILYEGQLHQEPIKRKYYGQG